jgi:hypothetical protein
MNLQQRQLIEDEIKFLEAEEKRLNAPCIYLFKRTRLRGKLDFESYLKNGSSKEDKELLRKIFQPSK